MPLERNFYGHPLAGLLWGKTVRASFVRTWMGEIFELGMCVRSSQTRLILVSMCHHFLTMCIWDAPKENANQMKSFLNSTKKFESRISAGATQKLPGWKNFVAWSCDMEGHAKKCVERYCGRPSVQKKGGIGIRLRSCQKFAHTIVLKCLYLARIGRPDILWSVNKLARAVTKWTQACDKPPARWISYIHHTNDVRQCCHVGNTRQQLQTGLFQDSDFAGDLEDSKSTFGGVLCFFLELFLSMLDYVWMGYLLLT